MKIQMYTAKCMCFIVVIVGLVITVIAILAPIIQSILGYPAGESLYRFLSEICHQYPTRSFWIFSRPMALCSRCLFGYVGVAMASIYILMDYPTFKGLRTPILGAFCLAPALLDASLQLATTYTSTNILRSITGFLGGVGVALLYSYSILPREGWMKRTARASLKMTLIVLLLMFANTAKADEVKLRVPSGTVVAVRLEQLVDPAAQVVGAQVQAAVASDVQVDGRTVIKAGAPVIANIEEVQKAASIGKGAKVTVVLRSVQAADGTNIPLSGSYRAVGESNEGSTIALGVLLCPLFLLREGDETQIASGAETRAMTLGDASVKISSTDSNM